MKDLKRLAAATLIGAAITTTAQAQISGMPLFTNPRYGTGVRIHADFGQATEATIADRVIQGGVSLALGPIGLGAAVGMLKDNLEDAAACAQTPQIGCESQTVSASLLAQLRVAGGGSQNLSLSIFGGASTDISAASLLNCSDPSLTAPEQQACQSLQAQYATGARQLNLPVGVAVGMRIPMLMGLTVWGAPRYNITKFVGCDASNQTLCDTSESDFRWAAGADLPILGILSVRAAYDSGKIGSQTIAFWGLGASIGLGGMR